MRWWLLMTAVLAGAGCATTAAGTGPFAAPPQPAPETVEAPAPDADQLGVVVTSTSPSQVQFRADARDMIVPLQPRHGRAPSGRRIAVHDGMWIGAALGMLAGGLLGHQSEQNAAAHPGTECYTLSCGGGGTLVGLVMLGAIGLGLGAAGGAIFGGLGGP
jgi:hypothetical protein